MKTLHALLGVHRLQVAGRPQPGVTRSKHICSVGRHPRLLILPSLLLLVVGAQAEPVTTAGQLCTLPCSTCTITGAHDVEDLASLDFGDCNIELQGSLNAEHSGESFTIAAGSLTLNNGKLRAPGTNDDSGGSISVEVTRGFTMLGAAPRINLDGEDGGGSLDVTAGDADVSEDCADYGLVAAIWKYERFLLVNVANKAGAWDTSAADFVAAASPALAACAAPGGDRPAVEHDRSLRRRRSREPPQPGVGPIVLAEVRLGTFGKPSREAPG